MKQPKQPIRPKPERVTGLAHAFAAARYSWGGIRRLWAETAFRHEVFIEALLLIVFVVIGAARHELLITFILFLVLVATEALNTAIECIVDHVSPNWAEFARDAKDLGSLAVFCLLLINGLFAAYVLFIHLLLA